MLTKTRCTLREFDESALHAETTEAADNPEATALDLVHTLAFHSGLVASLFTAPESEDTRCLALTAFSQENSAVVGTGIDSSLLSKLVSYSFVSLPSTSAAAPALTKYFGVENRIAAGGHGLHPKTIFVCYGATAPNHQELAALKAFLSPHPHRKYGHGSASPLFESLPAHARVDPVFLPYIDAALFGVVVQAPTIKEVHDARKIEVKVLSKVRRAR